jgi:hypothetical protein
MVFAAAIRDFRAAFAARIADNAVFFGSNA